MPVRAISAAVIVALAWAVNPACGERTLQVTEAVRSAERARIEVIARATRVAVSIFANEGQGGGSGVVVSPDGYALTNFHVVQPAGDYMKCSMADGRLYDAVVVGIDPTGDLALIQLLGRDDFPSAELGDSDQVRAGDWCFAVGNPFLLATDFQPTVTWGLVSGVHRYQGPAGTLLEYADCVQTDASINPGNSGGPLFNAQGQLIGINGRCSFEKRGRVSVGVGYAISINQAMNFLGCLKSGRIVDHATLGATVSSDEDGRVVVTNLLETSDAYRRGLRYGDEILEFGGRPITTVNGFKNVLGIFPKGWRVPLEFERRGERRKVHVRLAGVHAPEELLEKLEGPPPQLEPPPKPAPKSKIEPRKLDELPEDRPDDIPAPQPAPTGDPRAKIEIPELAKSRIISRKGFANYFYNLQNRSRVWAAFTRHGDFSRSAGAWTILARDEAGRPIEIELAEDKLTGRFPRERAEVDLAQDLSAQRSPAGSGGLLLALHAWQRLLTVGPERFGDVLYLGTAPLIDREGLYDVLVGTHDVLETRFDFDPATGLLVGLELVPDEQVDPCEVSFDDYRDVAGVQLPHRLLIRHGDDIFARLDVQEYRFQVDVEARAAAAAGSGGSR